MDSWKCSRPGLEKSGLVEDVLTHGTGLEQCDFKGPSDPNHSLILCMPKVPTSKPFCGQCCIYRTLIIPSSPNSARDYQVLNFMHWPCGAINSTRLSVCRQPGRLEAELRHGNEGLEDDRTAETSRREPKAKLGHLGLAAAQPSSLLQHSFCFWGALQVSNLGLMGGKKRGRRKKKNGNKMSIKVSWASFN